MSAPCRVMLWHWGRHGGGPRVTLELARALAAVPGVEVHLSLSRQSELFDDTTALGLPGWHVDTYASRRAFACGLARLPGLRRGFRNYLRGAGIGTVVCTMIHLWNVAMIPAIRRAGARYVCTVHDATLHPGEESRLRSVLMRREILAAERLAAPSAFVAERLETLYGVASDQVLRLPLGPLGPLGPLVPPGSTDGAPQAETMARPLSADRGPQLLFFGRLLPYKGLDLMVQSWEIIRAARPDARLRLVGTGSLGPLAGRARAAGIAVEERWVGEDEIPALVRGADLLLLPYREASQSGVIPYAYGPGVPCVVTPVGGLPEQIGFGAGGAVASDVSASAIARAVLGLLDDPVRLGAAAAGMRRLGREVFAWEDTARRLAAAVGAPAAAARP